jgi:hypothetical protein
MKIFREFILFLLLVINFEETEELRRDKRYLIFPPSQPAFVELSIALGIPLSLIDASVTLGWGINFQYLLPYSVSLYVQSNYQF